MWLIPKDDTSPQRLKELLDAKLKLSRFHARTEVDKLGKNTPGVKITVIRLKRRKGYCGAHPGPCLAGGRKHMNAYFLEGLDWVGFNALLNDMLDAISADCMVFSYNREAICSGRYYIRRNRLRRTGYPYDVRGGRFAHWTQTKDDLTDLFKDYCGKEPPDPDIALEGLDGTPGYPCYTLAEEDKHRAEEAEAEGTAA